MNWEELETLCRNCRNCGLCQRRQSVVFGGGNRKADILFVGEAPGAQEDRTGTVFVGPAGQLLDKMLASIGLTRDSVYLSNIVKCHPPNNRDPLTSEREACLPYLREQVFLQKPKIIVCLGRVAAQVILRPDFKITREHGVFIERKGTWMTATFHPSALLRDPSKKRPAYEDLLQVKQKILELGLET